ncbi:MAG: hypothetical protein IKF17_01830 [Clostridia bacterium]|nr:hypothetical protein [Clostridia bacterium]
MKKNIRENKGITLIALVITIIVLLILTGITIASLTGENGLLSRSSEARNSQNKAQIQEELQLIVMESMTEQNGYVASEVAAKIEGAIANGDSVTGTYKGYSFSINSSGKVTVRGENEDEYYVYVDIETSGIGAYLVESGMSFDVDNPDPTVLTTFSEAYVLKNGNRINISSEIRTLEFEDNSLSALAISFIDSSSPLYNYEGDYDIILIKDGKEYTYSYKYVDPHHPEVSENYIYLISSGIAFNNGRTTFDNAYVVINGTRQSVAFETGSGKAIGSTYNYIDLASIGSSLGLFVGREYEFILVKNDREYSINATIPEQEKPKE